MSRTLPAWGHASYSLPASHHPYQSTGACRHAHPTLLPFQAALRFEKCSLGLNFILLCCLLILNLDFADTLASDFFKAISLACNNTPPSLLWHNEPQSLEDKQEPAALAYTHQLKCNFALSCRATSSAPKKTLSSLCVPSPYPVPVQRQFCGSGLERFSGIRSKNRNPQSLLMSPCTQCKSLTDQNTPRAQTVQLVKGLCTICPQGGKLLRYH